MNLALIAAYNESKNIEDIVRRTKRYVDIVVVVDDGSSDHTSKLAKKAGAKVIISKQNEGKSAAMLKGIQMLEKYKPKTVVFMDADGQHLPEEIPKLLELLEKDKVDVVYGTRKFNIKQIKSAIPGKLVELLFGGKDILCGFKAIRYEMLRKLELSSAKGYLFELVLHKQIKSKKLRLATVPITAVGVTRISWLKGIKLLFQYIFGGT